MSRYSLPLMFSFVTVAFRRNGGPAENNHQTGMFCRQNTHSTIGPTKSRNLTSTLNNLSDTRWFPKNTPPCLLPMSSSYEPFYVLLLHRAHTHGLLLAVHLLLHRAYTSSTVDHHGPGPSPSPVTYTACFSQAMACP